MSTKSLDDLPRRIAAGDERAEEELVEALGRGLSLLLRRQARDPELARDLYQETFRIVITSLRQGKLEQAGKLAAFVRGTAKNLLRAEWRKRDRRGPHDDVDEILLTDPAPGQWHRARAAEDRRRVQRVLDELRSERDRQVLLRHYWQEEPKEDTCAALGIGTAQYNLVLFRARQRFRQLLEKGDRQLGLVQGAMPPPTSDPGRDSASHERLGP